MLRIIRIIIAIVSFMAMTVLFVDFTGSAAAWLSFLPKVQLVPAIIALNFVAIAVVLCLTLLFGRLYCSVLCPLGIFQDIVGRIKLWLSPKKKRRIGLFHTTAELSTLRYLFFGLFAVLFILGLTGEPPPYRSAMPPPTMEYGFSQAIRHLQHSHGFSPLSPRLSLSLLALSHGGADVYIATLSALSAQRWAMSRSIRFSR